MSVVADYTALLSGSYWNGIEVTGTPVIVTFSFPTVAPDYDSGVDGFTAATVASFQAFSAAEQAQALDALGEWAAASGLVFIQVAPGQGDINFQKVDFDTTSGPSYSGSGGIAFYPFGDWNFFTYPNFQSDLDASGDVFMNTQFETIDYGTLLHEIGHAIGLKHPTEVVTNFAADPDVTHDQVLSSDDPNLTIMATVGGAGDNLKTLDQNAAAFLYGGQVAGKPDVVTGDASASYTLPQNSVIGSWTWNATTQTLTQFGRSSNDTIRGSSAIDVMNGGNGDDRLFGLNGNDTLNAGGGNDELFGGPGADRMVGGVGDDTYYVDNVADTAVDGLDQGYDTVIANVTFKLANNLEQLQLFGGGLTGKGNNAANTIFGDGTLSNTLFGLGGDDYIVSGSAADTVRGGNDNDTIYAGEGDDVLTGDAGDDWLYGEGGNDSLNGGAGIDVMYGGDGDDIYVVDNVGDQVFENAGEGYDKVVATVDYVLQAGSEIDMLSASGGTGRSLTGNEFTNRVNGAAGGDTINGGLGKDVLTGGGGADTFVFDTAIGPANLDRITDFAPNVDHIQLDQSIFASIGAVLDASEFHIGTAAADADDFIIYDSGTGLLSYDADGVGGAAAVKFATVTAGLSLHNTDFLIG